MSEELVEVRCSDPNAINYTSPAGFIKPRLSSVSSHSITPETVATPSSGVLP